MGDITIIFPHQLFRDHPALQKDRPVCLVEEYLFFRQYNFHKQKLVLHRASMKYYEQWLAAHGYVVSYTASTEKENDCRLLVAALKEKNITGIHIAAVADDWLHRRLQSACSHHGIDLHVYATPNFLNTTEEGNDFYGDRNTYFQTDFYKWQRRKSGLLMDRDGQPYGGRWSFDEDNRERFPKNERIYQPPVLPQEPFVTEAREYVEKFFPDNYGSVHSSLLFAVTHEGAEKWLDDFLAHRLEKFGVYQDAIVADEPVLYHSVLTPLLNTGLLHPQQVIGKAMEWSKQHVVPLNSLEGFIRQIIGWREFVRIVYEREGRKQRTANFWNFSRKIPQSFWTAKTGILPIDATVRKVLRTGYCHHIERLMVLGNFMLLCEFDPGNVYRWFMEMFIDAYDWVMVPNVYGMTQFADGGLMATKPYISASNYLMKMSDYKKGRWQKIWDSLFWRFLQVHRDVLQSHPRLGMLITTLDKMNAEKRTAHLQVAEEYLQKLDMETPTS